MKALIIYDSLYGNTEKIARSIGTALGSPEVVEVRRVGDVKPEQLEDVSLLVVGSPTQRFNATPALTRLLKEFDGGSLKRDQSGRVRYPIYAG